MNLQPSEAEAGFDVRVPPNADPESLERRIAQEWAPASRNMTFEVAIQWLKHFLFSFYFFNLFFYQDLVRNRRENSFYYRSYFYA